jgi:hypothetical protein
VTRIAEGSLSLGTGYPELAAQRFLSRFALSLFGVAYKNLSLEPAALDGDGAQVIGTQIINGLMVLGSRINLNFDPGGNLIYALSDLYRGTPPSPLPMVSAHAAASLAQAALLRFLAEQKTVDGGSYPQEIFLRSGKLMYRLVGSNLSLVYRYGFPLQGARDDDMEIIIDAREGSVVIVRSLSRR